MLYNIILISVGLLISLFLFNRFPTLTKDEVMDPYIKISVIIPARNEEKNLSNLLQDLKQQTYPIHEIICVDDCSVDHTAEVASSFGVKLITLADKPSDWTGKAWACQKGAEASEGDLLLFLDADVRLSADAVAGLKKTYHDSQCVISVQPYHQTMKSYEQFSLFFNLIQTAANGMSMISDCRNAGLCGPVILIHQESYQRIEGHEAVKSSIVDDLTMGEELTKAGIPFKLFLGGEFISFRMYSKGISELLQGWTKNFATGALKTPKLLFIIVFLWITSSVTVITSLIYSVTTHNLYYMMISSLLYVLWVLELCRIADKIGKFRRYTLFLFPPYLIMFLYVFILSMIKKLFRRNVIWKGRRIKLEK